MIGSVLLSAFLAAGIAAGDAAPGPEQSTDDGSRSGPPPLADLDRLARLGRLDGVTLEYWVGGGLPPPYYRSDQSRLLTSGGRDLLEFARPCHDPINRHEGLVEKFAGMSTGITGLKI